MAIQVRDRRPPVDFVSLYGPFADQMRKGGNFYKSARDDAAYVHVVGTFPTGALSERAEFLEVVTQPTQHDMANERAGDRKVIDEVVRHLQLESHWLVEFARAADGYIIEPGRKCACCRDGIRLSLYKRTSENVQEDGMEVLLWYWPPALTPEFHPAETRVGG